MLKLYLFTMSQLLFGVFLHMHLIVVTTPVYKHNVHLQMKKLKFFYAFSDSTNIKEVTRLSYGPEHWGTPWKKMYYSLGLHELSLLGNAYL